MKDTDFERIAREALKNCNFKDDDYDEADRELGIIKVSEALRKYQSRIGELEKELSEKDKTISSCHMYIKSLEAALVESKTEVERLRDLRKAYPTDKSQAEISALQSTNSKLRELVNLFIKKRSVDGLNGRNWEAGEHLKAEEEIKRILASKESEGGKP